jgi:hypothetical protein
LSRGARRLRGILTETRARLHPTTRPPVRAYSLNGSFCFRAIARAEGVPVAVVHGGGGPCDAHFFIFEYGTTTPPPSFAVGSLIAHTGRAHSPRAEPPSLRGALCFYSCVFLVLALQHPDGAGSRTTTRARDVVTLPLGKRRYASIFKILLKRAVQQPSGFSRTSVTHPRPWPGRRRFVDLSRARRCGR